MILVLGCISGFEEYKPPNFIFGVFLEEDGMFVESLCENAVVVDAVVGYGSDRRLYCIV